MVELWNKGLIWDTLIGTALIPLDTIQQSDEVTHFQYTPFHPHNHKHKGLKVCVKMPYIRQNIFVQYCFPLIKKLISELSICMCDKIISP